MNDEWTRFPNLSAKNNPRRVEMPLNSINHLGDRRIDDVSFFQPFILSGTPVSQSNFIVILTRQTS